MTKLSKLLIRVGRKNQLILIIIILLIADYIIIKNMTLGSAQDLTGQIKSPNEVQDSGLRTIFWGFPFLSIIIGSIVSLFRSKEISYKKRLINSSLIILLVFYLFLLIFGIRNLILW